MKVNSYLRMVLMFGENKAPTLYKNLERMIALVLYDVEKEHRESHETKQCGITIVAIMEQLKNRYSLNFSDVEIINAIENRGQSRIICIDSSADQAQKLYAITPTIYNALTKTAGNIKLL